MVVRVSRVGGRPDPVPAATPVAAERVVVPDGSDIPIREPAASTFDTVPIVGIDQTARIDPPGDDRAEPRVAQARAHQSAAELLADRGDWRRAYHHLRAAMTLVHLGETPPVQVPEQLRREVDRLRRERAEAREQSRRDSLTATWNRRYLDERMTTLRDKATEAIYTALVDVDHFKLVNDTYGHATGDSVLQILAGLLDDGVRELTPDAFCARYGGEEFALVLTGTDLDAAVRVCESVRARVEEHDWSVTATGLQVTVSVGLGCLGASAAEPVGVGPGALDGVDELLYIAKRAGRNAVAFRDPADRVRLAGPAAGRRGIDAAVRTVLDP